MFVIRLRGTDLLFPMLGGRPPRVFGTRQEAERKIRYEFTPEERVRWEVVPYDAQTMRESAPPGVNVGS